MRVTRIVTNIATAEPERARAFYCDVLGLEIGMDMGWIVTFVSPGEAAAQLSIASGGGSGASVPDISIEVDRIDEAEERMREAGIPFEYGPAVEPWGVKRFFVRDPFGTLVNVLAHTKLADG